MRRKILIVDDILSNRLILKEILKEEYEVLEAVGGKQALTLLHDQYASVSAVLLDISMPGMDGYEVLRHIREDIQLAGLPVIMITSSEGEQSRVLSLASGANDYITKPYKSDIVKHCLRNQIALHEASETVAFLQRDQLTRLYTRETFFTKMGELLPTQAPGYYILSCIDVDNFKLINDLHGIEKGDAVLKSIAVTLRSTSDERGGICGRISADNFVTLFPRVLVHDGIVGPGVMERHVAAEVGLQVTISVGRYLLEDMSLSPVAMYDRAYIAKNTVKGRYDTRTAYYDEAMRAKIVSEQEIVSDMKNALANGQFEIWFQPQYNHSTGALIGSEALVRWRHPSRGLIPPNDFIPVFEKNGFVYSMDQYVWEQVCRYLRKWLDEGRNPLPVSVNISRYDLQRPELTDLITGLTEQYRLSRDLLRLEITESAFSESPQRIVGVVKELIALGFTVEIDDFGSGYSSLNTLKDAPAQILKLDMRFLESGKGTERGGNILESVVRMTKWLGMSVIAEGVETREQADYLKSIGCTYIQGYLYARPMPAAEYEAHCRGLGKEERLLKLETVENMDNNDFWSPESMSSMLFNSYVGAACIFEFHNGEIEVVRSTDLFAEMISAGTMSVADTLKLDWAAYLDEENTQLLISTIEQSVKTKNNSTNELVFQGLPGCPDKIYLRCTMRVIATAGERRLIYNLVANITAQREAEQKESEAAAQIRTMMNDMPGGFALLQLMPDGSLKTLYANDGLCAMRKMTRAQLMHAEGEDALTSLHPDDLPAVHSALRGSVMTDETFRLQYRLRDGEGAFAWVSIFGRTTRGEHGEVFLNIYFTELSAQEKKNLTIRETMPFILNAIMDSSQNLDFAKDKDFNYICCSPAFVKFTRQKSAADVIGKNDYDFWTKEEADRFRADDMQLFASGESLIGYTEPIPSDDNVQHFSVTSKYILRDSAGEIIGLYGSGRDITNTRAALDRLQLLTDSIPGGIASYAVSPGKIEVRYFNDGFCKLLGCTREDYMAHAAKNGVLSMIVPESTAEIMQQLNRLLEDGTPIDCTYRCRKLDGSGSIWINLCGVLAERYADTAFVNTVLYDVTARHEAEQQVRETSAQMRTIMENVRGGISATTLDEHNQLHLVFANTRYYEMFGYTKAQFEAEIANDSDLIFREDSDKVLAAMQRILATRSPDMYMFRCKKRDGSTVYLRCNAACTTMSGVEGTVLLRIFTDVTGIIQAQQREKDTQRALLDNMPYGAALFRFDGQEFTVIHLNKQYWELVERESKDYEDLSFIDAVHPDDRKQILPELNDAIREKRSAKLLLRIRSRQTDYKTFQITANIQQTDRSDYLVYAAYERLDPDTLSYQQALPLLLSAVMESANDFSFAKDRSFRYLCASPAFLRLASRTHESEIIGKTDWELFPADMAEQFRKNDVALMEGGKSLVDFDEAIRAPDGSTHYCRASKYLLRNAVGDVIGLYGVSRDITKERSAFEQLRLLNDTVPGGIVTYSIKGEDIRISYCNGGFCRLFGGTLEGLAKRKDFDPMSWVFEEDRDAMLAQIQALVRDNTPLDCVYRAHIMGGGYKWINKKAVVAERRGDTVFFNALLLDVTERQSIMEQLRISEEEKKLAVEQGGSIVCRYDIAERTLTIASSTAAMHNLPSILSDVPYAPVRNGMISPETADAYIGFFEAILKGNKAGSVLFQQQYLKDWRWEEAKSSTVFADDGSPVKAVISMRDVTDRIEKEAIYKKWQQSLAERDMNSYTLMRTNISRHSCFEISDGALLTFDFHCMDADSDTAAKAYAQSCICADDRNIYVSFVNCNSLLSSYYSGKRSDYIEYREQLSNGDFRWLRLSVDLVESPNSTDVEAYLMYENIDEAKREELQTKELSETDPLTGVLNRKTFAARVGRILQSAKPGLMHALLMLDIDNFKQVNDVFGHGAGDQALIDLSEGLRSITRTGDLVARLGGDEFMVFLSGVADSAAVIAKSRQIRALTRKAFSLEVHISASIGIAFAPQDGLDFETLYKKTDTALYYVKSVGKDSEAAYREDMASMRPEPMPALSEVPKQRVADKKRRMLIVDDSSMDNALLQNIFSKDFIIEKAKDGNTALIRLRHFGSAISVVLLDLMMPGMDGFAVLEKMQESPVLRAVPVIIVSGDESREACLNAIRKGATDFITKPVDADILRIRVHSAVSKAENEWLRAKNSLLELQTQEQLRYESYLVSPGITFIEYNWHTGEYRYYPSISKCLYGNYDRRKLWQILLSDMVADTATVQDMQTLVHRLAEKREETSGSLVVKLKTPKKTMHRFRMDVRKVTDEFQLTNRLIISLTDLEHNSP